jgi:hypothetical protein
MGNPLSHEVAIAVAQGGTVKYQDDERAVVEIVGRPSTLTLVVGTLAALILPGFLASIVLSAAPAAAGLVALAGTVALLIYVWRPKATTWELWLEDGEVRQRKAA